VDKELAGKSSKRSKRGGECTATIGDKACQKEKNYFLENLHSLGSCTASDIPYHEQKVVTHPTSSNTSLFFVDALAFGNILIIISSQIIDCVEIQ
jgi:hypothetical protein